MKIVLNKCYGGFSLSPEASKMYNKLKNLKGKKAIDPKFGFLPNEYDDRFKSRIDPVLIRVVEELGEQKASGKLASLEVIEIPDDVDNPHIDEYDGIETLEEGRRW